MSKVRAVPEEREWLERVGTRIGIYRRRRGWTIQLLAKRTRVDKRTILRIESGEAVFSIVFVRRIADALGIGVDDLLKDF